MASNYQDTSSKLDQSYSERGQAHFTTNVVLGTAAFFGATLVVVGALTEAENNSTSLATLTKKLEGFSEEALETIAKTLLYIT